MIHKNIGFLTTIAIAGALAVCLVPVTALAAAPGVARISVVQGGVAVVRGDSATQVAAARNAPVLAGDTIATTSTGRVATQFDSASVVRLDHNSQMRFVNLTAGHREAQLAQGTADLVFLRGVSQSQIDTPSVVVRPRAQGVYRVSVLPNGRTVVTVRSGSAVVYNSTMTTSRIVTNGQSYVMYGGPNVTYAPAPYPAYDSFDQYNNGQNNLLLNLLSSLLGNQNANYNSYGQMYGGYQDLAGYGQWQNSPQYGSMWYPSNQTAGWSPYQNGQWVWEPGYGYTWVANEPWGWAPYHYGSWAYNQNNGWGWVPPSTSSNLLSSWAPALVGFLAADLTGNSNAFNAINNGACGYGEPVQSIQPVRRPVRDAVQRARHRVGAARAG